MSTHCFVDSDHWSDKVTRRSQAGVLLSCNRAPIIWYSKGQSTVESRTIGAEFIAVKIAVEVIEVLRYQARMFGISVRDQLMFL